MVNINLPVGSIHLRPATNIELVRHGLSLHLATLWGALRTSPDFRSQNPDWKSKVLHRFLVEYGMNVALLIVLWLTVVQFFNGYEMVLALLGSLLLLPVLSVAQVISDRVRGVCEVYTDSQGNVGMTVKVRILDSQGSVAEWAFLNHYALPVGKREGVRMRNALHEEAQQRGINVLCHAQNDKIAEYYSHERPGATNLGGKRPLLHWKYRVDAEPVATVGQHRKFDPFGFSSLRDSGQVPL